MERATKVEHEEKYPEGLARSHYEKVFVNNQDLNFYVCERLYDVSSEILSVTYPGACAIGYEPPNPKN